ncbi:S-adenosyl-L-methionine-dependent methyltransferase [Fusarium acuminatum]|uniref:S-adenosyl-L-methionine-dependent methyltransferase n=1 Tax=Fusarium acuminatum TaxID=5515 RepID=A0ABZ2X7K1_9HYPO
MGVCCYAQPQHVLQLDKSAEQKVIAAASAIIQELENPGEQLARIGWGEPTQTTTLRTLFDLGILQKLGEEPQGSEQLAAGTKADPVLNEFYPYAERLTEQKSEDDSTPWLVDVGGGLGHELLSLAFEETARSGKLVLQDLPAVIEEAKSSGNLPKTIEAVPHDFFKPQPVEYKGAQDYFMRLILHDWPDAKCATILSHLRDAMVKDRSRLLINETVLRDVGAPWQQTSLDWTMMGMLVNRERTESQWHKLLADAGLKITGIYHKGPESVIEAMLVGMRKLGMWLVLVAYTFVSRSDQNLGI